MAKYRFTDEKYDEFYSFESKTTGLSVENKENIIGKITSHIKSKNDYKDGFQLAEQLLFKDIELGVSVANGWYTANNGKIKKFYITALEIN
jgi:hypothetical protein